MRKRRKRGLCTPSPRKMKDWNLFEQAYLDLLESVCNETDKSMGEQTSMRFWEIFAIILSENQGFTVNADDCVDQLVYLETLYNQLKWEPEPEPERGSYLQLCGPEFRQQLLNIFDKFTIKLPSDRAISRWKNKRNRSEQTCSSNRTTCSRSGLGSNSVPGGGLVKASEESDGGNLGRPRG